MAKAKKNKKPSILQRNELHADAQRRFPHLVEEDKTKRIPRKAKYKKNTRDYL